MAVNQDALRALIAGMSPDTKAAIVRMADDRYPYGFFPSDGPQTMAYHSKADHLLYGGAAGGGKSALALGVMLQQCYQGIVFRLSHADIVGPSGLEATFKKFTRGKGRYNGQEHSWRDNDKDGSIRSVEFGALEKPNAEETYQGHPHDGYAFDEAAQMKEAMVRYVQAWKRSERFNPDGTPQRTRSIYATNPPRGPEGAWIKVWWAPWIDPAYAGPGGPAQYGELRWAAWNGDTLVWMEPMGENADGAPIRWLDRDTNEYRLAEEEDLVRDAKGKYVYEISHPESYTFIRSMLSDNPYYAGTGYDERLSNLPEVLRKQMAEGDFWADVTDQAYQIIPREWVDLAQARWRKPSGHMPMTMMGVDVAQGGKDRTTLAPLYTNVYDEIVAVPGIDTKRGADVAALVVQHRKGDAIPVVDCTGAWGSSASDILDSQGITVTRFVASAASGGRTRPKQERGFWNQRAEMWWRFREALDPASGEDIALPPDPALKEELCSPVFAVKGDKILVESKDELRKRLGRSTDRADPVLQAWLHRNQAVMLAAMKSDTSHYVAPMDDAWAAFR